MRTTTELAVWVARYDKSSSPRSDLGSRQTSAKPSRVYLNDKADAFLPPYDSPEQRATLEERADLRGRDFWLWSRADTHRCFLAGQGLDEEFDALWSIAVGESGEFDRAIADRSYAAAGGTIGYLVSGRKPG